MEQTSDSKNNSWIWMNKKIKCNEILPEKESNVLDYKECLYLYHDKHLKNHIKKVTPHPSTPDDPTLKINYKKLSYVLTKYLLAFLNTNGGALVFGVRDSDTKAVGLSHWAKVQEDGIKMALDNSLRCFAITPRPVCNVDYKFEFIPLIMDEGCEQKWLLILEVKKSEDFHYCIIGGKLRSWERLNVSLIDLSLNSQELMSKIQKQRSKKKEVYKEDLNRYFTLVFPDKEILVSEQTLQQVPNYYAKRIYRFEMWCSLDDNGKFRVNRPSKYFLMIYQYIQIGIVAVPIHEFEIFLLECKWYEVDISNDREIANGYITIYRNRKEIQQALKSEGN